MHDRPEDPCWEARELCKPQVGYCVCPAYDGEITLIPVPEWFRFPVCCHTAPNDISDVLALLDSRLSYSRHHHGSFRLDAQQLSNVAEMIVANGELPRRINLRSAAQARTAGAVRARKPATAPIPTANAGT